MYRQCSTTPERGDVLISIDETDELARVVRIPCVSLFLRRKADWPVAPAARARQLLAGRDIRVVIGAVTGTGQDHTGIPGGLPGRG